MRWIGYAGLVLACCAALEAGTLRLNPEAFALEKPKGSIALSSYLEDLPLGRVVSLRGRTLRLENYPGFGVELQAFAQKAAPGPVKVRIRGRTLAGKPAPTFTLDIIGFHYKHTDCTRSDAVKAITLPFELMPDKDDCVELTFDLDAASLNCKQCGKPFESCLFTGTLRLSSKWEGAAGVEISGIEFVTAFPAVEYAKPNASGSLRVLFREEAARLEALRQKHLAVLRGIRPDNRFNAESFRNFPPEQKIDGDAHYFTAEELAKLNPEFEIRRLASWPFYDHSAWTPYETELYGLPGVTRAFLRNGVIYAIGTGFAARWDAAASRWDYAADKTVFRSCHTPVKHVPEEAGNVYLEHGKLFRLFDGAEVAFPADATGAGWGFGQYAATGGKVYWIANGRRSIRVANPDFSKPATLEFTPPGDAPLGEINAIFAAENNGTLLIEHHVTIDYNRIPRCLELDLADRSCRVKLPPRSGRNLRDVGCGWIFFSNKGQLLDLGKGKPFVAWKGNPDSGLPMLGLDRFESSTELGGAVRVGPYLAIGKTYPGRLYFLNLFDPRNSLKLNGFYHYRSFEAIPGGEGIWVTMPDGLYEVRPKTLPPLPELVMPKTEKDSIQTLPLIGVIGEVTPDAPALFDGELKGDGFVMTLRPMAARTALEVGLKLPGKGDGKSCWLFRFSGDGSGDSNRLFTEIELVGDEGRKFMRLYKDSKTLYVPADVTLIRFVSGPSEKSRTVVLKEITLTKNPLKESKK